MILTGRRFPGSSAPGDLSSLGVGGRPGVLCGGLCAVRKAFRTEGAFLIVFLKLGNYSDSFLESHQSMSHFASLLTENHFLFPIIHNCNRSENVIVLLVASCSLYLPGEGAVTLPVFFPDEEESLLRGKLRVGPSGRDRLLHDFLANSQSFRCRF